MNKKDKQKRIVPAGSKHKNYAGDKGEFIQRRMAAGRTNNQARQDWKKSEEKKKWDKLYNHLN